MGHAAHPLVTAEAGQSVCLHHIHRCDSSVRARPRLARVPLASCGRPCVRHMPSRLFGWRRLGPPPVAMPTDTATAMPEPHAHVCDPTMQFGGQVLRKANRDLLSSAGRCETNTTCPRSHALAGTLGCLSLARPLSHASCVCRLAGRGQGRGGERARALARAWGSRWQNGWDDRWWSSWGCRWRSERAGEQAGAFGGGAAACRRRRGSCLGTHQPGAGSLLAPRPLVESPMRVPHGSYELHLWAHLLAHRRRPAGPKDRGREEPVPVLRAADADLCYR